MYLRTFNIDKREEVMAKTFKREVINKHYLS